MQLTDEGAHKGRALSAIREGDALGDDSSAA